MIYLDASALVTLLARRTYAKELREFLDSRPVMPMATSTLGFVETVRTMRSGVLLLRPLPLCRD